MDEPSLHPVAHVESAIRHQWMREECAALNTQRQSREDGLMATIIQISSAALLAIPGLFFNEDQKLPSFDESPLIYLGVLYFGIALFTAMIEQYLSIKAHGVQIRVTQDYYFERSCNASDPCSSRRVYAAQKTAYIFFGLALLGSAIGLIQAR